MRIFFCDYSPDILRQIFYGTWNLHRVEMFTAPRLNPRLSRKDFEKALFVGRMRCDSNTVLGVHSFKNFGKTTFRQSARRLRRRYSKASEISHEHIFTGFFRVDA